MILLPDPWWPTAVLAVVLLVDAAISIRPPKFIRDCLDGVGFPRGWWWVLFLVKFLAVAGLVAGIVVPGIAFASNLGVIAYILAAASAHLRARFLKQEFWLNCLGMLVLSLAVLLISYWS